MTQKRNPRVLCQRLKEYGEVNRKLMEDKDKEVESFNIWNIVTFNAELWYIHYRATLVDF